MKSLYNGKKASFVHGKGRDSKRKGVLDGLKRREGPTPNHAAKHEELACKDCFKSSSSPVRKLGSTEKRR